MNRSQIRQKWPIVLLVGLLLLAISGSALAAEFAGDENVYRLAADQVVNDDLYVGAGEIYIDGTVKGDLFVAGGYIEINGVVEGDLFAAGGGVVVRGHLLDDARIAGGGIDVSGTIGDDLFIAGGGGQEFDIPMQLGGHSIQQGIRVAETTQVGGDAIIVGGGGRMAGNVSGDLWAGMGTMELVGQVGGNADLNVATLRVDEGSTVAGMLRYRSPEQVDIPGAVAADIQYEAPQSTTAQSASIVARMVGWLIRTVLMLVGFALLGWLLLRFAPSLLSTPVAAIEEKPLESALFGLLVGALLVFIPILSVLLVVLTWIFWGTLPALLMFSFLAGSLALVWVFSPLITGLWLGQRIVGQAGRATSVTIALLIGVLLIVVVGRIPFIGWLVYLASFALALGGVLRSRRQMALDSADGATPMIAG